MMNSLQALEIGGGKVQQSARESWELRLPAGCQRYADAQLDDHHLLTRRHFRWAPPVSLSVQARVSTLPSEGTFGFGFWNDPFSLSLGLSGAARKLPASPRACWFFYGAPPHDLALTRHVSGHGWKVQCLKGPRLPGVVLLPAAASALALTRVPILRKPLVRIGLGMLSVEECELMFSPLEWHTYRIEWRRKGIRFMVDDDVILQSVFSLKGPLGFIAWIDNQYAIVSPQKGIRFGIRPTRTDTTLLLRKLTLQTST